MAITITDPSLVAEIEAACDIVEFRDSDGRLLSVMTTNLDGPVSPWLAAKLKTIKTLTAEELAERRKIGYADTKTTEQVLASIRERHPELDWSRVDETLLSGRSPRTP